VTCVRRAAAHGCPTAASRLLQVMMTFLLIMTVYASAVSKPGHGNTAPLAIGLSLYAAALTGESRPRPGCQAASWAPGNACRWVHHIIARHDVSCHVGALHQHQAWHPT
jgi:glycerol uptake facilitator-like aquaporin